MFSISTRIEEALQQFENKDFAQQLFTCLAEQHFAGYLSSNNVQTFCQKYQFTTQSLALILLPVAACYAHTPISQFRVGAIAHCEDGSLYFGANQEFQGSIIQQTIHAEQSAISHALTQGATKIQAITVNYTPCGHCRQFMNELNSAEELLIHLPHSQSNKLSQYLPDAFGPKDLDIHTRLFDKHDNKLQLTTKNALILTALQAANQSHAPYSRNYHGIALKMQNGHVVHGSYIENAAFNPSLPAMQVALNGVRLQGYDFAEIQQAIMVEHAHHLSYRHMSETLLRLTCQLELNYIGLS
ncbi:cytidine deaminase [Conservatibacter flavescens]|uniref:Cytidine deaminase n=1 Tax=Conservatibacter flavescens TaxID=28161 RepID=A0A2M8S1Z7_9PAST|nr:cytidine deaminase [Conservatibacter flavescens]PJG85173.1 cytidine deaminase [Conservatibacter flavescens]